MVFQRNGKPKILATECDKRVCPAGKSGCCCHMVMVIWKLDEIFRNKKVQPIDTRSSSRSPLKGTSILFYRRVPNSFAPVRGTKRERCSYLNKICQWSFCRDNFTIDKKLIWLRFAEIYCTAFASGFLELFHLTFPYFVKFF